MKALILTRPGELELAQRAAPPEPGPGEALVKIVRAGVCGTDMHAFAGRQPFFSYPRVLGHELGVDQTITPGEQALEKLQTITGGDLPTVVFDATGNLESMKQAFKDVAHGGKLVFVGLAQGQIQFDDPDFHRRETTLFASRNSRGQDFRRIIDLVEAEKIDTRPWITHRCGLAETTGKFPEWVRPGSGVLKAIIEVA